MAIDLLCPICSKKIGKTGYKIQCCGKCARWVHLTCTPIKKEDLESKRRTKIQWICNTCKKFEVSEPSTSFKNNGATILDSSSSEDDNGSDDEYLSVTSQTGRTLAEAKFRKKKSKPLPEPKKKGRLTDSKQSTDDLLKDILEKLHNMETAMTFNNHTVEEIKDTIKDVVVENNKLKKECSSLKQKIQQMELDIRKIKGEHTNNNRSKNLVIMGLQSEETHDRSNVIKLLNMLEVNVEDSEFSIKTIPSKMPIKPLLVSFNSEDKCKLVLQRRKEKGKITSGELQLPGDNRNIFVNEDMPQDVRHLYGNARSLKKHGFKFVWQKYGSVFCRKSDTSEIVKIKSNEQIDLLKSP